MLWFLHNNKKIKQNKMNFKKFMQKGKANAIQFLQKTKFKKIFKIYAKTVDFKILTC